MEAFILNDSLSILVMIAGLSLVAGIIALWIQLGNG